MQITRDQATALLARAKHDDVAHALLCFVVIEQQQCETVVRHTIEALDHHGLSPRTRHAIDKLAGGRTDGPLFTRDGTTIDIRDARRIIGRYTDERSA